MIIIPIICILVLSIFIVFIFWLIIKQCIQIFKYCCNSYNCCKKNQINPELQPDDNFDIIIINNTDGNGDQ